MTLQDLTEINPSDSTCKIMETLNFFNINFNSDENKFLSLAYGCRNLLLIFSFKKQAFADTVFTLMFIENNPCRYKNFIKYCNI